MFNLLAWVPTFGGDHYSVKKGLSKHQLDTLVTYWLLSGGQSDGLHSMDVLKERVFLFVLWGELNGIQSHMLLRKMHNLNHK